MHIFDLFCRNYPPPWPRWGMVTILWPQALDPRLVGTRKLMTEIPKTSPCYLTTNQIEQSCWADHTQGSAASGPDLCLQWHLFSFMLSTLQSHWLPFLCTPVSYTPGPSHTLFVVCGPLFPCSLFIWLPIFFILALLQYEKVPWPESK